MVFIPYIIANLDKIYEKYKFCLFRTVQCGVNGL